jgi:hypothetical protein
MKIRPVGVELFLAVGQTDMTKQIVTFCTSRSRLKKAFMERSPTTYQVHIMNTCQMVKILNRGLGGASTYMHAAQ